MTSATRVIPAVRARNVSLPPWLWIWAIIAASGALTTVAAILDVLRFAFNAGNSPP